MIRWDKSLWLLTKEELNRLPDGTVLECIHGRYHTKGPQLDTQGVVGWTHSVYGVRNPLDHEHKHLLMVFMLKRDEEIDPYDVLEWIEDETEEDKSE